jgi:hypothetical protein
MNSRFYLVLLIVGIVVAGITTSGVFAQEEIPTNTQLDEIPIEFTAQEAIIAIVGTLGGLTTAYLGYRKAKTEKPDLKFDVTKFFDRIIMAVIPAIGFAIAASAHILELNIFTLFMVFTASLGTSELIMEIRNRNGHK